MHEELEKLRKSQTLSEMEHLRNNTEPLIEDLIKIGLDVIGNEIFRTWSCYSNGRIHCGKCESCNNRKSAFLKLSIEDKTRYQY